MHFRYVHGNLQIPPAEVRFGEGGRSMHMVSYSQTETPVGIFDTTLETDSWGLGLTAVRICGIPTPGLLMYSSTSPVDRRLTAFALALHRDEEPRRRRRARSSSTRSARA